MYVGQHWQCPPLRPVLKSSLLLDICIDMSLWENLLFKNWIIQEHVTDFNQNYLFFKVINQEELELNITHHLFALVVSNKIFEKLFLNIFFWRCDQLMHPTGAAWTTLVGDHPGIIAVKYGQNPVSAFSWDVSVKMFLTLHITTEKGPTK